MHISAELATQVIPELTGDEHTLNMIAALIIFNERLIVILQFLAG